MTVSPAGMIGAAIGIFIGVIGGRVVAFALERRLRLLDRSLTAEEQASFERKIALMRRLIVGIDIVTFAAVGYWAGTLFE
ncbi:MAG: hypothetical protein HY659_08190 [Rhizobiales bacterium]|nr:hypothetical protein [Hyphomicrobiales bacterium]